MGKLLTHLQKSLPYAIVLGIRLAIAVMAFVALQLLVPKTLTVADLVTGLAALYVAFSVPVVIIQRRGGAPRAGAPMTVDQIRELQRQEHEHAHG